MQKQLSLTAITSHAYNADRTQVAVCENSNVVKIYSTTDWSLLATLDEHDKLVTAIDWAPRTNRLVTCAQDRNAYVWTPVNQHHTEWKPTLVLLRLNRSATVVKWAPTESKFAVGSGARAVAVCTFDEESDWWVAKHLKKPIRSTVLDIDWHPNGVFLAAGSADMKARVFSTYTKGDDKPGPSQWGQKFPFNTLCGEYSSAAGGWVHSVAFSPSGDFLAFASHDSTITVVYPSAPDQPPQASYTIRSPSLPYMSLMFVREDAIVAAGHDCEPVLFQGDLSSGWSLVKSLDSKSGSATQKSGGAPGGRLNSEAFNRFKAADTRGVSTLEGGAAAAVGGGERQTVHQNTITNVSGYAGQPGNWTQVATSGVDGRLVVWSVA